MFRTYPSNIALGTGHNWILCFDSPRRIRARGYFRALSHTPDTWRFWFSNAVDSTFDQGAVAYPDRPGGNWRILSARVGDGGACSCEAMPEPAPVTGWVDVTFDGRASRDVASCERFWSDEISFTLPEDHYIVWEWELEGNEIPCTPDSQAPTFTAFDDEPLTFRAECPLPDLFGARREVAGRIAFWGDSITQGCGTRNNFYEHWSARAALALGKNTASGTSGSAGPEAVTQHITSAGNTRLPRRTRSASSMGSTTSVPGNTARKGETLPRRSLPRWNRTSGLCRNRGSG